MQQPTCVSIRIRSTSDAHKIFGAVQQGILRMVTRRLDADERLALRSGCVYAWEERGPHSELTGLGIERFTEGRRWSPSRVRDEFLFYYEKYTPPPDTNPLRNAGEQLPPRDWDGLVKQTYSVWVQTENGRRKWHLTAYFTQATIDQLDTIDDDPRVRDIVVPDGMFKSTRVSKGRARPDDSNRTDAARAATTVPRTYAPFPTPYQYQAQNGSPSMTPVLMHEPYQTRTQPAQTQSPMPSHEGTVTPENDSYVSPKPIIPGRPYTSLPYTPSALPIRSDSHSAQYPNPNPPGQPRRMVQHGSYYQPETSTPNWDSGDALYRQPGQQHIGDLGYGAYFSTPQGGAQSNQTTPSPHNYDSTLPPSQLPSQMYQSPYMLQPMVSLPKPQEVPDPRGYALSPLPIPIQLQPDLDTMQSTMVPMPPYHPVNPPSGLEPDFSLAPLTLPRPGQLRYVRDPEDEKTLRSLLREERTARYSP